MSVADDFQLVPLTTLQELLGCLEEVDRGWAQDCEFDSGRVEDCIKTVKGLLSTPLVKKDYRMSGADAACIIRNVVQLIGSKAYGRPLYFVVSEMTGHGSTYAVDICLSANLNPTQTICKDKPLESNS